MSDARYMEKTLGGRPEWWNSDHWATPWPLVRELEAEFGAFDLDPCCLPDTAKAPKFFTPEDDGLSKPWRGRVFLNPPYSKPAPWLEKAIHETTVENAELVVALIPVSSDTRWFHRLATEPQGSRSESPAPSPEKASEDPRMAEVREHMQHYRRGDRVPPGALAPRAAAVKLYREIHGCGLRLAVAAL